MSSRSDVQLGLVGRLFLHDLILAGILLDVHKGNDYYHIPLSKLGARLAVWGDGYSAKDGRLDMLLSTSVNLRNHVGALLLQILILLVQALPSVPTTCHHYNRSEVEGLINSAREAFLDHHEISVPTTASGTSRPRKQTSASTLLQSLRHSLNTLSKLPILPRPCTTRSFAGTDRVPQYSSVSGIIYNLRVQINCLYELCPGLDYPARDYYHKGLTRDTPGESAPDVTKATKSIITNIPNRHPPYDLESIGKIGEDALRRETRPQIYLGERCCESTASNCNDECPFPVRDNDNAAQGTCSISTATPSIFSDRYFFDHDETGPDMNRSAGTSITTMSATSLELGKGEGTVGERQHLLYGRILEIQIRDRDGSIIQTCPALIDTGADINLVSKEMVDRCELGADIQRLGCENPATIRGLDGQKVEYLGTITFPWSKKGGYKVVRDETFYVVEKARFEVILSNELCQRLELVRFDHCVLVAKLENLSREVQKADQVSHQQKVEIARKREAEELLRKKQQREAFRNRLRDSSNNKKVPSG